MRVFIIGAGGFIGGHVAAGLAARGHEVHALAHTEPHYLAFKRLGYVPVMGNMLHDAEWRTEAALADALVNCAQLTLGLRHGARWLAQAIEAEQQVTRSLLRAALAGGRCRALVDTSGLSALGDQGSAWVSEATPPQPSGMGSLHLSGEALIRAAAEADGVPGCSLRPGLVYSSDGGFAEHFLGRGAEGTIPIIGEGLNFVSPVHVEDLVEAYARAIEGPPPGAVLHVCDDRPVTLQGFAEAVLAALGVQGRVLHVPPAVVSLFAGPPIAQMSVGSVRSSNDGLREALGWRPRFPDHVEGLAEVVARWRG